jgi:hypothetical protein
MALDYVLKIRYSIYIIKRKREIMTKNETVFISAHNGGLQVFKGVGNLVGFAKTPKMLAYIMDTHKIFGDVMFTSSMDFADEEGFDTWDGARVFWQEGIEMRWKI